MKAIFVLVFFSSFVYAECDQANLKKEFVANFREDIEIVHQDKKVGVASFSEMTVTDSLLKIRNENFLVGNLKQNVEMDDGKKSEIKSLVVASVDLASCTLDEYQNSEVLGASLTKR